jgi:hypothetical protein
MRPRSWLGSDLVSGRSQRLQRVFEEVFPAAESACGGIVDEKGILIDDGQRINPWLPL